MVYSFAQYFLRQQLANKNDTVLSQSGKLTAKPSMKWIYRLFHGVGVLKMSVHGQIIRMILNLDDTLRRIIEYFDGVACRIYQVEDHMHASPT